MTKHFLFFLIGGALLGGVTCDISCFFERMRDPYYYDSLGGVDKACTNYRYVLQSLRGDIRSCGVEKICLDGAESFFHDFCEEDSSLKDKFLKSYECILGRLKALQCMPTILVETTLEAEKEECRNREKMESCIIEGAGEFCGADAKEVAESLMQLLESFYRGFCTEIGGAEANSVVLWSMLLGLLITILNWY